MIILIVSILSVIAIFVMNYYMPKKKLFYTHHVIHAVLSILNLAAAKRRSTQILLTKYLAVHFIKVFCSSC